MSYQKQLTTEHLVLKPLTLNDARAVQLLAGDRTIADMTAAIPHPYPDGVAEAWIATHADSFARGVELTYGIFQPVEENVFNLVGCISLLKIDRNHSHAEIGYWIGRPFWNQGYATEAVRALIAYGFEELGLNRIYAIHFRRNPASGRVLTKAGLKHEGCQEQHFRKNEHYEDLELYGLVKLDFYKSNESVH